MPQGKGKGYHEAPGSEGVAINHREAALRTQRKKSDLSNIEIVPSNKKETEDEILKRHGWEIPKGIGYHEPHQIRHDMSSKASQMQAEASTRSSKRRE